MSRLSIVRSALTEGVRTAGHLFVFSKKVLQWSEKHSSSSPAAAVTLSRSLSLFLCGSAICSVCPAVCLSTQEKSSGSNHLLPLRLQHVVCPLHIPPYKFTVCAWQGERKSTTVLLYNACLKAHFQCRSGINTGGSNFAGTICPTPQSGWSCLHCRDSSTRNRANVSAGMSTGQTTKATKKTKTRREVNMEGAGLSGFLLSDNT